uniref:Uncharacterized protein n=1 Tax=viral metagenome TaxID=1070528 RepID=A0A6C0AY33_9ZZZZ|tara:strand:- start:478 stop:759 length:282 start_codon:yes stop_codon:yes gene_type:complete
MQNVCLTEVSKMTINNTYIKQNNNNKTSLPIPIPRTNSKNLDLHLIEQYSLKSNIFDPSKMSPPDTWKCRLKQRIKDHETNKNITYTITVDNE